MKLSELFESGERREEKRRIGDGVDIYNPTILDVEPGNMIRVKGPAKVDPERDTWGQMVLKVDHAKQMVLVRDYVGGSLQFDDWTHIDDVIVTWNIGGMERAKELMGAFEKEMKDTLDKREVAKAERRPTPKKSRTLH